MPKNSYLHPGLLKLTQAGFEVLEKSRAILSSLSDLRASTCGNSSPVGPFRLGLSHALARPEISKVVIELGKRFPQLQPSICNDISCQLLARLHLGEHTTIRLPQLQLDGMKRMAALGRDISIVEGEKVRGFGFVPPGRRQTQSPRTFYRREPDMQPLVIAEP